MKEKAIQLREALERINEDLLALSDDIWLSIDHNDAQGLEKGVAFKQAFNEQQSNFAAASQGIIEVLGNYGGTPEPQKKTSTRNRSQRDRKIQELDKHKAHALSEEFAYKRPYGMTFEGEAYTDLKTWKAVYRQVLAHLLAKDKAQFRQLDQSDGAISRRGNAYITKKKSDVRQAMDIGEGLYVEVNLSANLIRDSIARLLNEFSIPHDQITFYLREDRDAN
tara:strand:- start:7812 stop:8477 length:666 start_codon:yes stop_codon:yes gene_type:complete